MSDVFHRVSMVMNVDPDEIAKIVHDYLERGIVSDYDRLNCPKPPIYIGPVKVKTLKERLEEEVAMHADCEDCIKRDICTRDVPKPCRYRYTEEERKADQASDIYGTILAGMYLPKTYLNKKEDNEMKATSTETFHDIIAVDFELQTFPNPDVEDKFIVSATNRDDIFCFVFEGPSLRDACRNAGLFVGWEKDQKIKELEEELSNWKKEAADCLRLRDEAQKEAYKIKKENEKYEEKIKKLEHDDMLDKNAADYWSNEHDILLKRFAKLQVENEKLKDKLENVEPFRALERTIKEKRQLKEEYSERINTLQRKYNLEKAANEAQHKFFVNYAGKGTEIEFNYAIGDTEEVSYVIVDKKTYDEKPNINLHGKDYTPDEIVDRVLKLEEENNRLKDTSKEGDYVCLNSVPYCAEDIKKLKEQIKKLEKLKTPTIENFVDEEPSSRRDILRCAEKCVCGHREQDYGTPESNFQLIADLWNGYLGEKTDNPVISVTPVDVSMMMALMKIARIRNGGGSGDSFVDLAGYAACGGEIWALKKGTDGDSN